METKETKTLYPLREVVQVRMTGRSGRDISPHMFWTSQEYIIQLSCTHEIVKVINGYYRYDIVDLGRDPIDVLPLPKRMRCNQCPGREVEVQTPPEKPIPELDPMGVALSSAYAQATGRMDAAERWDLTGFAGTERVYADVAIAALDVFSTIGQPGTEDGSFKVDPRITAVVDALRAWGADPSTENTIAVRKRSRTMYRAQHYIVGTEWRAVRAMIEARKATPQGILSAIPWVGDQMGEHYTRLSQARLMAETAAVIGDGDDVDTSIDELKRIWAEERPGIHPGHEPLIVTLLDAYAASRRR